MAIVTLRLPDETLTKYQGYNQASPAKAMEKQLEKFKEFSPNERVLLLSSMERQDLEKLVGLPFENGEALVTWAKKLLTANIEGVEVTLDEGQRKRLQSEAGFYKKDPTEWIKGRITGALRRAF